MNRTYLILISVLLYTGSFSQKGSTKTVVILKDSLYLFNKGDILEGGEKELFVKNGFVFSFDLDSEKVNSFIKMKGVNLDGIYELHYSTGIPMMIGRYTIRKNKDLNLNESVKDGDWYYWNDKGILMYKEVWKVGVLVRKAKYKTAEVRLPQKKSK